MAKSILDDAIKAKKKELAELEAAKIEEVRAKRKAQMEEQARKTVEFANMLYKRYGVENNPKRDACFSIAWDYGHAYGETEVASHFDRLVELIK